MKYRGQITGLRDVGDEAEITIENVRRDGAAEWREHNPALRFRMPHAAARGHFLGRKVTVIVTERKK